MKFILYEMIVCGHKEFILNVRYMIWSSTGFIWKNSLWAPLKISPLWKTVLSNTETMKKLNLAQQRLSNRNPLDWNFSPLARIPSNSQGQFVKKNHCDSGSLSVRKEHFSPKRYSYLKILPYIYGILPFSGLPSHRSMSFSKRKMGTEFFSQGLNNNKSTCL